MVAVDALNVFISEPCSYDRGRIGEGVTYTDPSAKVQETKIFDLFDSSRFRTIAIGSNPRTQSVTALILAAAYVQPITKSLLQHLPSMPPVYLNQKYATGWHWNAVMKA